MTWKSIKQQQFVDIQTTRAAFIMKVPESLVSKSAGGAEVHQALSKMTSPLQMSDQASLSITTMMGSWDEVESEVSADYIMFPSSLPVPGLSIPIRQDSMHRMRYAQACVPSSEACEAVSKGQFALVSQPSICTSAGPFRLTGAGWDGHLSFHCIEKAGEITLQVVLEASDGQVRQWRTVGPEVHVWIQSRNPQRDEVMTLVVVKAHGAS